MSLTSVILCELISGLQLTLFTEQEEYISIYGHGSGARVSILPHGVLSFPVDEGINVKPGTITSIALKEVCCYNGLYNTSYSRIEENPIK